MKELFQHQKKIIDADKKWFGKWLGTGGGKTRTCLELAEGRTLVICPKQQFLDRTWERNADEFGVVINMDVISKETFRRDWDKLPYYDTVIVDEAHHLFGVTTDTVQIQKVEYPKTSQLYAALKAFLVKHPPKRFYPASATPASKPMHVWGIAQLFGENWDFFAFRSKYYIQRKAGWRSIWIAKNGEEQKLKLAEILKRYGDTGRLSDWFDVPPQIQKEIEFGLTAEQKAAIKEVERTEADPMGRRAKIRTIENGCLYDYEIENVGEMRDRMRKKTTHYPSEKIDYIVERSNEFKKMIVFANYTGQLLAIEAALKANGKKVFLVTGKTEHRDGVFITADLTHECVVVVQAQISEGYEFLRPVECVIFASKSNKFRDFDQAKGRPLRANALNKNLFLHLVVKGGNDEKCHKTILSGEDFQEKIYA